MPLKRTRIYFAGFAVAALTAGSASATTQFTTQAAWAAALTVGQPVVEASAFTGAGISNTLVAGIYGSFFATGTTVATSGNQIAQVVQNKTGTMTITAPSGGSNALSLWLGANVDNTGTYAASQALSITLTDSSNNTQTFTLTTGSPSVEWGFTSGTSINTITISAPSGYDVDLADFFAGSFPATPTPAPAAECATALLLGAGLIFLGCRRKFASMRAA
jgi:hypothetical protein